MRLLLLSLACLSAGPFQYALHGQTKSTADKAQASAPSPATIEEATRLAGQGQRHMNDGKNAEAVEALAQAVELVPTSADLRNKLALAHYHNKEMHSMWLQLREGAKLDLNHKQISNGLMSYWRVYDKRGLFNVGVSTDQVRETLGEPDHDFRKQGNADHGRMTYGFLAVEHRDGKVHETLDLRGMKPEHFLPQEIIKVNLDGRGWQINYRVNNQFTATAEYTLPGQQVQDWKELVSVQRMHSRALAAPDIRVVAEGMMASLRKTNPDAKYSFLAESPESVLLEWTTAGNKDSQAQHEIVKLFKAERDIHRIAYVKRTSNLEDVVRKQWIAILNAAKLETVTHRPAVKATAKSGSAKPNPQSPNSNPNPRLAVWEYGRTVSSAAIMHFAGGDSEKTMQVFNRAKVIGASLDLQPPEIEAKRTGTAALDHSKCLEYCLATAGVPAFQKLFQKGGKSHAALLEISIKSNLLTLIYKPGHPTSQIAATAIREKAGDAGLPEEHWRPLVDLVESKSKREDVVKQVLKMHQGVRSFLADQK